MADEQIGECPIMILGNKIDKQGAASEEEIRHYFGLHGRTTGRVGPCITYMYSHGFVSQETCPCYTSRHKSTYMFSHSAIHRSHRFEILTLSEMTTYLHHLCVLF